MLAGLKGAVADEGENSWHANTLISDDRRYFRHLSAAAVDGSICSSSGLIRTYVHMHMHAYARMTH